MGIGLPPRSLARLGRVAVAAILMTLPAGAFGQAPPSRYRASAPTDQHGYPLPDGYGYEDPYASPAMRGGFTGPFPMGSGGTNPPHGYDLMNDVGVEGWLVDQRGPHYFDVRAEAVHLERDETFGRDIDFSSDDIGPPAGTGPIVLSSGDLDYDGEVGFRILGRYDIDPLAVFEFGYMGIYDYESSASATPTNPGELFSLFSVFGNNPNAAVAVVAMRASEGANRHTISIESELHNAELSYRRYWVGYIPRVSGTLFAGFRYTKLNEEFSFVTVGQPIDGIAGPIPTGLEYAVDADNDLAGFQTGGDVWIGLIQGLRIGAEGKVGLYNNHYTVETEVESTPPGIAPEPLFEQFRDNQPAFIAEASVDLVADIFPSWSVRAGYEILFINSIVLAGDNFNTGSPYNTGPVDNGLGPPRTPFVADQSHAFYHGCHVGFEYIW